MRSRLGKRQVGGAASLGGTLNRALCWLEMMGNGMEGIYRMTEARSEHIWCHRMTFSQWC